MKILIGTVTSNIKDYCWVDFKKQLIALQEMGHDVLVVDNSETVVNRPPFKTINYTKTKFLRESFAARNKATKSKDNPLTIVTKDCMNIIRDEFLAGDYTHLFVLESDVFLDKDFRALDELIKMDCDVANFTYMMRLDRNKGELSLCVQSTDASGRAKMISPSDSKDLANTGVKVFGVDTLNGKTLTHCGYGCTLIARRVLEKIDFKAVRTANGVTPFPDSMFHTEVNQCKFLNKLNTDYVPYHCNIHGETKAQQQIIQIQQSSSRSQRREAKRRNKKAQR